jgi:putative ABC transport system permease protein
MQSLPFIPSLQLALRFALREMRSGLSGFRVFLACIALGVAAIGAVNAVGNGITDGIEAEGRAILGGDLRFELVQRQVTDKERRYLEGLGDVADSVSTRSMVRREDQADQSLAEVKAIDGKYPHYGTLVTKPALPQAELFAVKNGTHGAVAPQILFDRLGVKLGDKVLLGDGMFELRAVLTGEPDALSEGFGFAPRFLISIDGMAATKLERPGSLIEYGYKVKLKDGSAAPRTVRDDTEKLFPEAGWQIRTSSNASPALASNIERFSQFLTLVGLTALVVGGVGVANAVRAHLDGKRSVIATFKCLGAPGNFAALVYLSQILIIASIAIVIGLILAALSPWAAASAIKSLLGLNVSGSFQPLALILATAFGYLITLVFALIPLGHSSLVPPTELFRENGFQSATLPKWPWLLGAAVLALAVAGLAILTAKDRYVAMVFLGAAVAAFIVLRFVAWGIQRLARIAPRASNVPLRMAVGNIHRPGALTPSVVLSLGLGLTLLVSLTLIDVNLRNQISGTISEKAPNFFFLDVQSAEVDGFASLLAAQSPEGEVQRVPMLRGRITQLKGVDIEKMTIPAEAAWVTRGDRGITYAPEPPENANVSAGEWWPADYLGEPLVSFAEEEAGELGLRLGDTVTVNVLGRNITAKIANFRRIEWESMSINFVMVFSPNAFAGAPHGWLATLSDPKLDAAGDAKVLNAVTRAFPTVTSVRIKDALDVAERLVGQLAGAIRAAAAIALISSVLVLAGALAAGNRTRVHDSVILKMLGATRRTLVTAFTLEYFLIGLATALFGLAAGAGAAWFVVVNIMKLEWTFDPLIALATVAVALVLTIGFGLIGTWRVLGEKSAPVLRNL